MRGSPFLMPVYGAGVAFWQGCAAVKTACCMVAGWRAAPDAGVRGIAL